MHKDLPWKTSTLIYQSDFHLYRVILQPQTVSSGLSSTGVFSVLPNMPPNRARSSATFTGNSPALIFQQRKATPPTALLIKPKPSVFSLSNALRLIPWRWSKCYFSKFRLFNFNSLRRDEADHTKMMRERESEIERVCVTVHVCVMGDYNIVLVPSLCFFFLLPNSHTGPADRSAPLPIRRPTNI